MKVGYTYILTEYDCWIVEQALRQEPIDYAAIDYAELAANAGYDGMLERLMSFDESNYCISIINPTEE